MSKKITSAAAELILASISKNSEDGMFSSFAFGKPGCSEHEKRTLETIYFNYEKIVRAALFIRMHGHQYLKYLPMEDITSIIRGVVTQNYWFFADDTFVKRIKGNFAEEVSPSAKVKFADALANSELFKPRSQIALFPLATVRIVEDYDSDLFFLIKPSSLRSHLRASSDLDYLVGEQFPPLSDWKGRIEMPLAWLGVRSPAIQAAKKIKAVILGSLALSQMTNYRHMFSGRSVFGGHCTFIENKLNISFGNSHTPKLMHDIIITAKDHKWLNELVDKILSEKPAVRRHTKALEYYYRAWGYSASERFAIMCMTLDAIFGDANQATAAVIDGVCQVLGSHIDKTRLRALMELRASVIHGGAPDVYDSRKYRRYFHSYEADPIYDLELVVEGCLRTQIFGANFRVQEDPNAEAIKLAQEKGRLPRSLKRRSILDG